MDKTPTGGNRSQNSRRASAPCLPSIGTTSPEDYGKKTRIAENVSTESPTQEFEELYPS